MATPRHPSSPPTTAQPGPEPARAVTCGVLVTTGDRLLLGQTTGTARWDIPKGLAEPGEPWADAASRELREETGLAVPAAALRPLGRHRYLPRKDLVLFAWDTPTLDPATLRCTALVTQPNGRTFPELARFTLAPWPQALTLVGKSLRATLERLPPEHHP